MNTKNKLLKKFAATICLLIAFFTTSQIASAATYYLNFYNTTVSAGPSPVNPANGVVAIFGTNLIAGDVVVFDGVVISQNPGTGDQWGAINLNTGGTPPAGLTSATLAVKAETAGGTGNSELWLTGAASGFADVGATTNHVRIELTTTTTGSTTNMNYVAETDPNFTGTFSDALSGTLTFPNNIIPLTFGVHNQNQAFFNTSGSLAIAATPASSDPLLAGNTTTFSAIYQGPPASYSVQWLSNNVPIGGATSLTYTTPPIAAANNGDLYSVILLTNSVNCVTSSPSVLNYHAGPATWVFNFPNASWTGGGSTNTPIVSQITDLANFAPGDKVVFDGIIIGNGPWGGPVINGPASTSSQQLTGAGLGVLLRFGANGTAGAVYANAVNVNSSLTTAAAQTNHLRIELYISTQGSLANMGWKVLLDQNLTGTYSITASGTNLTFNASSLWLSLDSQNCSSISFAQYQQVLTAPTVNGAKLTAGMFQVTFTGPNGQPYEVLSSTNVAAPLGAWVTNSSGTFPGGNVIYTNQSPTDPRRFYRIKSP